MTERYERIYYAEPLDHFGCILHQDKGPFAPGDKCTAPELLWNELACVLVLLGRETNNNTPSVSLSFMDHLPKARQGY